MFQSATGQLGCISCDSLGDVYQELQGQTSCLACAKTTQRYVGGFSAANKSACQCKAGVELSLSPLCCGRVALRLLCRVLQADAIAHGRLDPLGRGCRGGAQPTLRLSAVLVSPRKLAPYFEPSFAVSFGLGWCCLCESHCVTSPQACLACPRGGYCDGKLNRPVPIQGRQTPADLWGPKVRLPVESSCGQGTPLVGS